MGFRKVHQLYCFVIPDGTELFNPTPIYFGTSRGNLASGIRSFQDGFDCSVVSVDCDFVAIEIGDKVGYCPYNC